MKFTIYDTATGQVLYGGNADDPSAMAAPGHSVMEGVDYSDGWIEDGSHHQPQPKPSDVHVFNWTTKQWEDPRTLAKRRQDRWDKIKTARESAEYAGFTVAGLGTFDSDPVSQSKIIGAVTAAQVVGAAFSINWTTADNSVVTLDGTQMVQVGLAMLSHVGATHEKGRAKRAEIKAASTPEQVDSVVW